MTSRSKNRLLSHPNKNTENCDKFRRHWQIRLSALLVEELADTSEVSLNSIYHQAEGKQKFSADILVALLRHIPTKEMEEAVNVLLDGTRFRILLLPSAAESADVPLLQTTAPVMASAGRLAEVVAIASADGHIDEAEARQIEVECCRQCETAMRTATQARRLAAS